MISRHTTANDPSCPACPSAQPQGGNVHYLEHYVGVHKMEAALSISSIGKYEEAYIVELENRFLESMDQISSMPEDK